MATQRLIETEYPGESDLVASAPLAGPYNESVATVFKADYLNNLATNPMNAAILAAKKQDLINGWAPKAPTMLCGGSGDPVVNFAINAQTAYDTFRSRGDTNVTLVDVDPEILLTYGNPLSTALIAEYHGHLESPFCAQAALQFFAQYK